jgi:asparagine synthetase B (glutamine-hydrolysing)
MCGFSVTMKNSIYDNSLLLLRGGDGISEKIIDGIRFSHSLLSFSKERKIQPISNKHYVMMFNGEIFNHNNILKDSDSDTDTLWRLLNKNGLNGFFSKLSELKGMFSIVIYDRLNREFVVITDKFGTKPCYVSEGDSFFISSIEPPISINPESSKIIQEIMYIPQPLSRSKLVTSLTPSSVLKFKLDMNNKIDKTSIIYSLHSLFSGFIRVPKKKDIQINRVMPDNKNLKTYLLLSSGLDSNVISQFLDDSVLRETIKIGAYQEISDSNVHVNVVDLGRSLSFGNSKIKNSMHTLDPAIIYMHNYYKRSDQKRVVLTGDYADELFDGYLFQRLIIIALYFGQRFLKIISKLSNSPYQKKLISNICHLVDNIKNNKLSTNRLYFSALYSFSSLDFKHKDVNPNFIQSVIVNEVCSTINSQKGMPFFRYMYMVFASSKFREKHDDIALENNAEVRFPYILLAESSGKYTIFSILLRIVFRKFPLRLLAFKYRLNIQKKRQFMDDILLFNKKKYNLNSEESAQRLSLEIFKQIK